MLKDGVELTNYEFNRDRVYKRYRKLKVDNKTYRVINFSDLLMSKNYNYRGINLICKSNGCWDYFFVYNDSLFLLRNNVVEKIRYVFEYNTILYGLSDYKRLLFYLCVSNSEGSSAYNITYVRFPRNPEIKNVKGIHIDVYMRNSMRYLRNFSPDEVYSLEYKGKTYSSDSMTLNDAIYLLEDACGLKVKTFGKFRKEVGIW